MAAERMSGYFAMCASIRVRSDAGTGVVAGSGTLAGSFARSAARSQPGTREPCPTRGTCVGSMAISEGPLPVDPTQERVEHPQRRDEVGDVGVPHHGGERLQVDEARVAHVH